MPLNKTSCTFLVVCFLAFPAYPYDGLRQDTSRDSFAQNYRSDAYTRESSQRQSWIAQSWQALSKVTSSMFSFSFDVAKKYAIGASNPVSTLGRMFAAVNSAEIAALRATPEAIRFSSALMARSFEAVSRPMLMGAVRVGQGVGLAAETESRVVKTLVTQGAEYLGAAPEKYRCDLRVVGAGKDIAVADMHLSWFDAGGWGVKAVGDGAIVTANLRWGQAAEQAAPRIAQLLDRDSIRLIFVPGINTDGLPPQKLEAIAKNIELPAGAKLMVMHSAGNDGGIRGLALHKGDLSNVYVLAISPRMAPDTFAKYVKTSGIDPAHVITVSSNLDAPHWPSMPTLVHLPAAVRSMEIVAPLFALPLRSALTGATMLYSAWHGYDKSPACGTHVEIERVYETADEWYIPGHGGVIDALAAGKQVDARVNGKETYRQKEYATVIEEIFARADGR